MTKAEIIRRIKTILYSTKGSLKENDKEFLFEYTFNKHPNIEEKRKNIIVDVIVDKSDTGFNKCFKLVYKDGTSEDISYLKGLNTEKYESTHLEKIAYNSVIEFVSDERDKIKKTKNIRCFISNEKINTEFFDLINYKPSMNDLLKIYLENNEMPKIIVKTSIYKNKPYNIEVFDDNDKFLKFYKENCNLKVILKKYNKKFYATMRELYD